MAINLNRGKVADPEVHLHNPGTKPFEFMWDSQNHVIAPGETEKVPLWLAQHAQKQQSHLPDDDPAKLKVLDPSAGTLAYAESVAKLAAEKKAKAVAALELAQKEAVEAEAAIKRATAELDLAKAETKKPEKPDKK